MKTRIGIIGGVGPQASAHIYKKLIDECSKLGAVDSSDYPDLIIHSLPIPDFISDTSNMDDAFRMLQEAVNNFEAAGCKYYCIASNTVHLLQPKIKTKLKFISIIDYVSSEASKLGIKDVGIVCSPTLNNSDLYDKALGLNNVKLIKLNQTQILSIEEQIRSVISGSKIVLDGYKKVLKELSLRTSNLILGCSELPLLNCYTSFDKVIDCDKILIENLVNLSMGS